MFTKCPQCHTAFRVTAPMLEAAQGRVRCGHCGNVFNALSDFLQASPPAAPSVVEPPPAAEDSSPDTAVEELPESVLEEVFIEAAPHSQAVEDGEDDIADLDELDDLEATGERLALADTTSGEDDEDTAEHKIIDIDTGEFEVEVEVDDSPEEAITMEGQSISIVNEATGEYKTNFAMEEAVEEEAGHSGAERPLAPPAAGQSEEESLEFSPADFAALTARQKPVASRYGKMLWMVGSGVLSLALAAQIVHFNAQALARNSSIGPALSRVYAALGAGLSPAWDLDAYQIRQWGASADAQAGGTLKVRASVFNGAEHAQPYPVLRLTLQDRFGGRVGSRDLEPDEYLHSSAYSFSGKGFSGKAPRLLGAGERVDAEIAILDPGKDAVGFEIDVCLRGKHNSVACANDAQQKSG